VARTTGGRGNAISSSPPRADQASTLLHGVGAHLAAAGDAGAVRSGT